MSRLCLILAAIAAIGLGAVGIVRGTYAAGGSDSSCYALMADAFASGRMQPSSALALQVPWPDPPKTFAPGGFVPSVSNPAAAAPVCAPGFSVLLTPLALVGGRNAIFLLTPLAGVLLVWLAFLAAKRLAGGASAAPAGAMAAILTATSPTVLYQVVQPMNDVTTAALWMAVFVALVARRWGWAGVCCGLALLVRPNLLPLAVVAELFVLAASPSGEAGESVGARVRLFALGVLPFLLAVFWLNTALYGGPLRTGYGRAGTLFSASFVATNAGRYARWLIDTQGVLIVIALIAPLVLDRRRRSDAVLALGLMAATGALYLAYTPFDDWSYLRFLMPAIVLAIVLMSAVLATLAARLPSAAGLAVLAILAAWMGQRGVAVARDRLAFDLHALEQRYRSAAIVARDDLPPGAAVLTTWDSGAIRFHAQKEAIVWDALDPAWLDRSLAWLASHGHPPYILVESWEEPGFRARFSGYTDLGKLDWPPKYEIDRVVRIYDPADRARFLRGEHVATEFLFPFLRR